MSKPNPYAAAICVLTNKLSSRGPGSEKRELEAAIRLLEAAGKVDKTATLNFLENTQDRHEKLYGGVGYIGTMEYPERAPLRALLEALPDSPGVPEGQCLRR